MATNHLASLKLTASKKPLQMSIVQFRRNKLVSRLHEQIELAKAIRDGDMRVFKKLRTITDAETGVRKQVEVPKRMRQWWFVSENGKLAVSVWYGSKLLELAKGKFAVEVASESELAQVLESLKAAANAGELDAAIEGAAEKLRAGFEK